MKIVRFPVSPDSIQNDSQPKIPDDIPDIVLQGYRRSLSDWLVICQLSYETFNQRLNRGYGIKQALVRHLQIESPRIRSRDLLFRDVPSYRPKTLSYPKLRAKRLDAWMAKYTNLPQAIRRVWAHRLLNDLYPYWREYQPWLPKVADYYPHAGVLGLSVEEKADLDAWQDLGLLVYGSWEEGLWATHRLAQYFKADISRVRRGVYEWSLLLDSLQYKPDEIVGIGELCEKIGVHKYTFYRAMNDKGLKIRGKKTWAEWLELARKADSIMTTKRKVNGFRYRMDLVTK